MNETYLNPVSTNYVSAAGLYEMAEAVASVQDLIEKTYGKHGDASEFNAADWSSPTTFDIGEYNANRQELLRRMYQIIHNLEYQFSKNSSDTGTNLNALVSDLKTIKKSERSQKNCYSNIYKTNQNSIDY